MENLFTVVTTFNEAGWSRYAKNFAETMDKALPVGICILLYYEGARPGGDFSDRVKFVSFDASCGEKHNRFRGIAQPFENHIKNKKKNTAPFKFEAVRFAHKYYACEDAMKQLQTRYLIWIDEDVVARKSVPEEFFKHIINDGLYWSRIGRGTDYPECGFMVWDSEHEVHQNYWKMMEAMYDGGALFKLSEWHDSYVWWTVEAISEAGIGRSIGYNLGDDQPGHAFVRGILGEYFDHLKGDRKLIGFSPEKAGVASRVSFETYLLFKRLLSKIGI